MNEQMDGEWLAGWINGWMDEWIDRRTDGLMDE